jgi:ABC-type branched-subunit amino acid transport system substrate-binding protein
MSGVPNISLSQKDELDGLGQYVFRMAMSNRNQIRRLVDYAMDKLGMAKFGVIYPEDKYGQELTKYFWEEVLKKGGDITAVESYETGQTDFRDQVKKILGVYYVGTRLAEYNDLKAQMQEDLSQNPKKKDKMKDLMLPPIQSFDALFIPDDARIAAQIAPYLPYYDAKGVILLGPNTWNSPQLISRGQNNVNGALFVDGFTSLTAITESRNFVKNFKDTFNATPGVLEAQAYDALNIVVAAMNNVTNRDAFRNNMTSIGAFTGATGKMKIEKNGDIDKQLFVLGVEKGKIILKD